MPELEQLYWPWSTAPEAEFQEPLRKTRLLYSLPVEAEELRPMHPALAVEQSRPLAPEEVLPPVSPLFCRPLESHR
jgi:hypothetical protein